MTTRRLPHIKGIFFFFSSGDTHTHTCFFIPNIFILIFPIFFFPPQNEMEEKDEDRQRDDHNGRVATPELAFANQEKHNSQHGYIE